MLYCVAVYSEAVMSPPFSPAHHFSALHFLDQVGLPSLYPTHLARLQGCSLPPGATT
uniref:Uncharacterized protein n=1 Tax=Arion vulgaris TaxID=1028688 RepID=A0A0B7BB89_9EUPU